MVLLFKTYFIARSHIGVGLQVAAAASLQKIPLYSASSLPNVGSGHKGSILVVLVQLLLSEPASR